METARILIFFALGILFVVKGGDWFVDAASWIAKVSGVPRLIVGATVVSLATTLPEMLVSVNAALQNKVDMSVGNAVGSVTANVGLIMAIAMLFMPMAVRRRDIALKGFLMIGAVGVLWAFTAQNRFLGFVPAVILLAVFAVFMTDNVRSAVIEVRCGEKEERCRPGKREIALNAAKFIVGIAAIVVGSRLLVDYGSELARMAGVSEGIISVTVIAVGTSLPELVTTVSAVIKKQGDLSVGNILGANIMDLTLILPICRLIYGGDLPLSAQAVWMDLPLCAAVCILAVVPSLITKKIARWQGVVLLAVYAAYVTVTCTGIAVF